VLVSRKLLVFNADEFLRNTGFYNGVGSKPP